MSFADALRVELCELPVKKNCCRRAFVAGILIGAVRDSASHLSLRLRYEAVSFVASEQIAKLYAKTPEVRLVGDHGHRYWDLSVHSLAAAKLVTQLQSAETDFESVFKLDACEGCRSALLRGLFLSLGSVSDPQKTSHLELLIPNEAAAKNVAAFLDSIGCPPKTIKRAGGVGLYYKNADAVGDLITIMGSHSIIFEVYNARIARDIRNNENRATNCVARNIQKSVSAAARQMEAIGKLMEHGKLEALEEPLRVTAMLRYRNPDATLDELKDMHTPPISKSGLNHRLQKLIDAAEK